MLKVTYVNANYEDTRIEEEQLRAAGMELVVYTGLKQEEIAAAVGDADALVVTLEKVSAQLIGSLPNLKVIGRMGVGYDNIDIEAATARGIPVINIPDYCVEEVALQAVSLMLAAHRKLVPANHIVRSRQWSSSALKPIHALSTLTLGLLGMGRIGGKVIEYMRPMVGRIVVSDPLLQRNQVPEGVELVELAELWAEADILTLHCPSTPDTYQIIRQDTIRQMAKRPILVNVSRGTLVHEGDVLEALNSDSLRYAALDVLAQEPPPPDHPLLDHPLALITNHVAWYSAEAEARLRKLSVDRVIDYLQGRPVPTILNRAALGV